MGSSKVLPLRALVAWVLRAGRPFLTHPNLFDPPPDGLSVDGPGITASAPAFAGIAAVVLLLLKIGGPRG